MLIFQNKICLFGNKFYDHQATIQITLGDNPKINNHLRWLNSTDNFCDGELSVFLLKDLRKHLLPIYVIQKKKRKFQLIDVCQNDLTKSKNC